jgi:ABC-type siderophore export system fused ATPase/permease subunit
MKKTFAMLFMGMLTTASFGEEAIKNVPEDALSDDQNDDDNPEKAPNFNTLSIRNIEKAYMEEMNVTQNELSTH